MNDLDAAKLYIDDSIEYKHQDVEDLYNCKLKSFVEQNLKIPEGVESIKVYKDQYCDKDEVLLAFKGKIIDKPGVIFCPYIRPTWYQRLWCKIKSLFKKSEVIELHGDLPEK